MRTLCQGEIWHDKYQVNMDIVNGISTEYASASISFPIRRRSLVCWNSKSTDAHLATSLDNEHASHREHTRPKDQFDSSVWSEKDFSWFRLLKVRPLGTVLLR